MSVVRRDSPTISTASLTGDCSASTRAVFFSGELPWAGANIRCPCSAMARCLIPSSGATKPASCVACTCFISGNNADNTSSVSNPPLAMPASRNARNGALANSFTSRLRFGEHVSRLFLDPPHIANPHLQFLSRQLLELRIQFQFAAQFQRRGQRHLFQVRIGLGKIEQHVAK